MVHGRIHVVDILFAQLFFSQTESLAETLEVDDLPGTQETDDVGDVGIVAQAEDIVVGNASLLLCCEGVKTTFTASRSGQTPGY